jgi:hypothetical protein
VVVKHLLLARELWTQVISSHKAEFTISVTKFCRVPALTFSSLQGSFHMEADVFSFWVGNKEEQFKHNSSNWQKNCPIVK